MAHTSEPKRLEQFVLKLHASELERLVRLAEANFRRPGDQLRYMITSALRAHEWDTDNSPKPQ